MSSHFSLGGNRQSESMVNTTTSIGAPRGSVISSPSTQTTAGAWNWRCHSSNTQCYSTRSFWTAPSRRGGSGPHWQILLSCAGSKELPGATRNPEWAILFFFYDLFFAFLCFTIEWDRPEGMWESEGGHAAKNHGKESNPGQCCKDRALTVQALPGGAATGAPWSFISTGTAHAPTTVS